MDVDELQSVGSADDRSRQSSLASLADDLTKRSTYSHRLGLGLDRALENLHTPAATTDNQFLSTAAAVATGTTSGFGSFRVPIVTEESKKKLSSLAEAAGDDDAEEEQVPSDAPMLQVRDRCFCRWSFVRGTQQRTFVLYRKDTRMNTKQDDMHACAFETRRPKLLLKFR